MKRYLPPLLLISIFLFALIFNCGGGGSDDDSTQTIVDDDDESDDDDVTPVDDDDSADPTPPVLSNVQWLSEQAEINGDGEGEAHLSLDICDVNNDLAPGGRLFLTSTVFGTEEYAWTDSDILLNGDINEAGDCDNPLSAGLVATLPIPISFTLCIDLEATDNEGNVSNKVTDVCIKFQKPDKKE